jgi:hypothetical protein
MGKAYSRFVLLVLGHFRRAGTSTCSEYFSAQQCLGVSWELMAINLTNGRPVTVDAAADTPVVRQNSVRG